MNDSKNKKQNRRFAINTLETLKEVGSSATKGAREITSDSIKALDKQLIREIPNDFMDQLFGPTGKMSAEIKAGESLEIKDIAVQKDKKEKKAKKSHAFERRMMQQERVSMQRRSNELRLQLQAISQEVAAVAAQTQELAQETKIAAMQAPVEPGIYHIIFFTNLLDFLKSFRKKIEQASVWLHAANGRAQKKNWVSNYKKSGAKYLLSGEHYLTRSAG